MLPATNVASPQLFDFMPLLFSWLALLMHGDKKLGACNRSSFNNFSRAVRHTCGTRDNECRATEKDETEANVKRPRLIRRHIYGWVSECIDSLFLCAEGPMSSAFATLSTPANFVAHNRSWILNETANAARDCATRLHAYYNGIRQKPHEKIRYTTYPEKQSERFILLIDRLTEFKYKSFLFFGKAFFLIPTIALQCFKLHKKIFFISLKIFISLSPFGWYQSPGYNS